MPSKIDLMLKTPQELANGLVIRRSAREDAEKLGEFNGRIFGQDKDDAIRISAWTKDMLSGDHPRIKPNEFTIVEEKTSGRIVSSMNLIPQTWSYQGIPIQVGRPEAVGTDPEFRNQGLVRTQFECIHEWSRQKGDLLQGITGIPYYYRLFGYEMTVELDVSNMGYESQVPKLAEGQEEQVHFRPATLDDTSFLMDLDRHASSSLLLRCERDENDWKYELCGRSIENSSRRETMVIQDLKGNRQGAIMHPFYLDHSYSVLNYYELMENASYANITPAVIRYLWKTGEQYRKESGKPMLGYYFALDGNHPAVKVARAYLPKQNRPYAWYIRVPDLLLFLKTVKPALEKNLFRSCCRAYTGTLELCLYSKGIKFEFADGNITQITESKYPDEKKLDASFPGLTFLQVLFGWRDIYEVRAAFPDCTAKEEKLPLVDSLFPKMPSRIWAME